MLTRFAKWGAILAAALVVWRVVTGHWYTGWAGEVAIVLIGGIVCSLLNWIIDKKIID